MKRHIIKEKEDGFVENFLGGVPFFGNFLKGLAKDEVFKSRFKEANKRIEENLKKGSKESWGFEANISFKPIIKEIKKEDAPNVVIGNDYLYMKKKDAATIAVKVPIENVDLRLNGKNLIISSENFEKRIELQDYFRKIKKRKYKKGALFLELAK